ncbi:MAG TPA: isoamylase early set domain-containing protein [Gemmatimonadaceae bacterium]|nr:isoamylase early set domain-containing protein [Gemmatimonadaceae bacterium]
MDERLQQALDDDLGPDALPSALALELEDTRALFDGIVNAIPSRPMPALGAAVLRRIDAAERAPALTLAARADRPRGRSRVAEWLWSSRQVSVSIRPVWALAAAAVFAVMVGMSTIASSDARSGAAAAAAGPAEVLVRFQLEAPQAQSVTLAGDFSEWSPAHTMQRSADGVWTIVVPLTPGVHEYAFVVDGSRWIADPAAPAKPDGFGGMNSRIAVLRPDARS